MSVRRGREGPLSLKQANRRLKAAVSRFRDRAGFEGAIGYTQENAPAERNVYALTVHVDEEGRPASYIGSVYDGPETESRDEPEIVERLHRRADEFEASATASIPNVTSFPDEGTDSVSTGLLRPDWRVFGSAQRDLVSEWGALRTDIDVGTYVYNDDDEPKRHQFGVFTSHTNSPGVDEYSDNEYHQNHGRMAHDYANGISLGRYVPSSNNTGEYSYSWSVEGGVDGPALTIGASYDPTNVSRFDESKLTEDRAAWDWEYNEKLLWDGATEAPDTFEPSSLAYTQTAPEQDDSIVDVYRSANWYNPRIGTVSPTVSSRSYIRYDAA